MPCTLAPWEIAFEERRIHGSHVVDTSVEQYVKMLCACCRKLELHQTTVPPIAAAWWEKHQAWDKQRAALAKSKKKGK